MSDLNKISNQLVHLLKERSLCMTVAESCTGGLISKTITDFPGSSKIFWGGYITYSNESKMKLLGVDKKTLDTCGAVSEETVRAMVKGSLLSSEVDCSVSVSGIAGPDGGTEEKPVGTVWISALLKKGAEITKEFHFKGNRDDVRLETTVSSLKMLYQLILDN